MTSICLESSEFVTTDGITKTIPSSAIAWGGALSVSGDVTLGDAATDKIKTTKASGACTSNAVTVNGTSGIITCESLTTAADGEQDITVTNSVAATTSLILLTAQYSGGGNVSVVIKSISNGSFVATLQNTGTAALDAAPKIHYLIVN